MTRGELRRYVAKETVLSLVMGTLLSTVPMWIAHGGAAVSATRTVHEAAVGLTPQFLINALMAALVPSLLTCWRQARGRLGGTAAGLRSSLSRAAAISGGLAAGSMAVVLALIHVLVAPLARGGFGTGGVLLLSGAQAALTAATVTPAAVILLLGAGSRRPRNAGSAS